jgi:hypothetical protein
VTPRQAKLVAASEAVDACKRQIESDWPRSMLDDPMVTTLQREIVSARLKDVAALDLASKTVMAVAEDPDAHGDLITLRTKDRAAYDAIMVLVKIELERKPAEQCEAA